MLRPIHPLKLTDKQVSYNRSGMGRVLFMVYMIQQDKHKNYSYIMLWSVQVTYKQALSLPIACLILTTVFMSFVPVEWALGNCTIIEDRSYF